MSTALLWVAIRLFSHAEANGWNLSNITNAVEIQVTLDGANRNFKVDFWVDHEEA